VARKKSPSKPAAAKRKPKPKPKAQTDAPEKKAYAPPTAEKAVTEFVWRGKQRFRCSKCQFDSGSEAETYQHFLNRHVEPPPKPKHIDTGLISTSGDKIVRVEEVQNGED
jgi:hypothetical protein